jgi:hypothetical protein
VGDEAEPESLTLRVPVAVTVALGFRTALTFSTPSLRVIVTVVFFARGTLMLCALGLADFAFPANDHRKW